MPQCTDRREASKSPEGSIQVASIFLSFPYASRVSLNVVVSRRILNTTFNYANEERQRRKKRESEREGDDETLIRYHGKRYSIPFSASSGLT